MMEIEAFEDRGSRRLCLFLCDTTLAVELDHAGRDEPGEDSPSVRIERVLAVGTDRQRLLFERDQGVAGATDAYRHYDANVRYCQLGLHMKQCRYDNAGWFWQV